MKKDTCNRKIVKLLLFLMTFSLLILSSVALERVSAAENEKIILTIPFFFENRIPEDITEIEAAVDTLVYEKIGVNIRVVPMLRLSVTDLRRNTEWTLLERGGASFDLVHASVKGEELLELTELLPVYGKEIVELFRQNGQDLLDGRELTALPSFSDYVGGQGIAMRKDIIEKYDIDISTLHTYSDFDQLFARLASLEPEMKMICSYSTGRGLLYRYGWNNFTDTVFCVPSGETLSVVNKYRTSEYEELVKLFRKWCEQGYVYEYSALQDILASEMVQAGTLFSYVCAYKPGIDVETSSSCGTEMVVVQTVPPIVTDGSLERSCWGISAGCDHPREAMQLLNLLYTDAELVNLLANGIENKDYERREDGTISSLKSAETREESFVNDAAWILPNQFLTDVRAGDDPLLWQKLDEYNRSAANAPNLGFVFDTSEIEEERVALNEIADQYSYGLESGQLDPDVYLEEMLEKMEQAGEEKVFQELSRQYYEWWEEQE